MPTNQSVFRKYLNDVFVETGSFLGDGIQQALEAGFKNVISIELADKYFQHCQSRFENDQRVKIVKGDSGIVLLDVIRFINQPITFWLDGHHSCGDTALGKYWSPLLVELEQIGLHHVKNHTILIDDMRCWKAEFDKIKFGEVEIKKALLEINPKYAFRYEDGYEPNDILVAQL